MGFGVDWRKQTARDDGTMARKLRMEVADGIYHVLNRGNYRAAIFRAEKTKAAFLNCLAEACAKTGWRVHAWCLMSNHYHLAVETPRGNLVEGMQWLQGTFSTRFNRLRRERGHLFQGRYKSLLVDPAGGLGPLCHYLHLNPVRAKLRPVAQLPDWPWSSLHWLMNPHLRPSWYSPDAALDHAGGLKDTPAGRAKYGEYLTWLAEDEPARKEQRFAEMSSGWVIGSEGFAKEAVRAHAATLGKGRRMAQETRATQEAVWQETLDRLLGESGRTAEELANTGNRRSGNWRWRRC